MHVLLRLERKKKETNHFNQPAPSSGPLLGAIFFGVYTPVEPKAKRRLVGALLVGYEYQELF